jgi:hypothetical protein
MQIVTMRYIISAYFPAIGVKKHTQKRFFLSRASRAPPRNPRKWQVYVALQVYGKPVTEDGCGHGRWCGDVVCNFRVGLFYLCLFLVAEVTALLGRCHGTRVHALISYMFPFNQHYMPRL